MLEHATSETECDVLVMGGDPSRHGRDAVRTTRVVMAHHA